MALTVNWGSRIIDSTGSITDLPAFHAELRDLEDSATGMVYPVTHSWKALDLGGAFFYGLELLNGYQLRFPNPGNYSIQGNLSGAIVPVAGVYVERRTSAAFSTTTVGGSGPSTADIAAAVRANMSAELLAMLEVWRIHGLESGAPLVVTEASRTAGSISQALATAGGATTVTRQ